VRRQRRVDRLHVIAFDRDGGYLGELGEGLSQRRTQPLHVFGQ